MPKAKKKAKKRSKRPSRKARKKTTSNKSKERMFFAIAAILILSALILSVPSNDYFENVIPVVQDQEQESSALGVTYPCDRNLECFLVGCKSAGTPSFMGCVNTMAQETFYEDNCEGYWDVRVIQDFTECACVQGLCKLIR